MVFNLIVQKLAEYCIYGYMIKQQAVWKSKTIKNFDITEWAVLCSPHGKDIDRMISCSMDYINLCVDNIVPIRKIQCFLNNKPWVTPDLKALLNEKKRVFRSGDKEELRRVRRELKGR